MTRRPRTRGVTIEDVARAAGVSRQTISNALNAPYRLKAETLERVSAVIEELGYRPDQSARSLKSGTRRIIGYPTPVDDPANPNPLMGGFLEAVVAASGEVGYRILLVRPQPGQSQEQALDELIAARTVDGFLLSDILRDDPRVAHLTGAGFPFAAFGRTAPEQPQSWVDVDSVQAVIELVGMVVARGHRRVAFLASSSGQPWMDDRRDGFLAGVRRHGLAGQVYSPGDDPDEIVAATRELLAGRNRPTAIVAGGDWLALGLYTAARAEGLEIGKDLAVAAFDDLPITGFLQPALTTVRLPLRRIAEALISRLLQIIEDGVTPQAGLLLPGELVIRPSLGP
ncbi:LacI family transcriptional regulator [Nonomuraea polychroma]|uniref:LacI family transcriptional regulator n=1 Tax=Nonomuraea polychroma TaxID=46176 RepID=A0A438M0V1_9ACTN|nr:LacI family DNA-binding transcriptional regulator [Nonomuraea polychroma]RVX39108.1 LacI family transcriptional regulator [Nonomuraea polychroma]